MRRLTSTILITMALAAACARHEKPAAVAEPSTRRTTASGEVVGFRGEYGDDVWRGIPFAAAPVGELRWRGPEAPPSWTGVREALVAGSPCTQYASPFAGVPGKEGEIEGGEDCLYLNVYAPRFPGDKVPTGSSRLPVMLWIHGGGNTIGEAGAYNGGHLAAAENVIVVTTNYRLGPFGWFRHAALRDGVTPAEQSGNFALLDLVAALTWVRDNAGAFGGDPGNVTIFGESAGGQNVFALLLAPQAKGLFHRAIVQSGGLRMSQPSAAENRADASPRGDANSSNEVALRLLERDASTGDRAAATQRLASMSPADVARYLRSKSSHELIGAYAPEKGSGMFNMPRSFRDGVVLPDADLLQSLDTPGGYNQVPVLLGTNRDESKLFMFGDPQHVRKILWFLPRLRDERMYNLQSEYMAKVWKANGADEPAAVMRAVQGPSVYVYRFDWDEEPTVLGADLSVMIGAAHGMEIPFVFGHFDLGKAGNVMFNDANQPGRLPLSNAMMSYWAAFARDGAPGRGTDGSLPEWKPWDGGGAKFMVFDTAAGGGLRMAGDSLTVASVLAAVDTDPHLASPRDKCTVLRGLAEWSRGFAKEQYAARADCKEFPFERFPWSA
jgi:para-nitrobenzyl esterase